MCLVTLELTMIMNTVRLKHLAFHAVIFCGQVSIASAAKSMEQSSMWDRAQVLASRVKELDNRLQLGSGGTVAHGNIVGHRLFDQGISHTHLLHKDLLFVDRWIQDSEKLVHELKAKITDTSAKKTIADGQATNNWWGRRYTQISDLGASIQKYFEYIPDEKFFEEVNSALNNVKTVMAGQIKEHIQYLPAEVAKLQESADLDTILSELSENSELPDHWGNITWENIRSGLIKIRTIREDAYDLRSLIDGLDSSLGSESQSDWRHWTEHRSNMHLQEKSLSEYMLALARLELRLTLSELMYGSIIDNHDDAAAFLGEYLTEKNFESELRMRNPDDELDVLAPLMARGKLNGDTITKIFEQPDWESLVDRASVSHTGQRFKDIGQHLDWLDAYIQRISAEIEGDRNESMLEALENMKKARNIYETLDVRLGGQTAASTSSE